MFEQIEHELRGLTLRELLAFADQVQALVSEEVDGDSSSGVRAPEVPDVR